MALNTTRSWLPRLVTVLGMLAICMGATTSSCRFGDDEDNGDDPDFVTDLTVRDEDGNITDTFDRDEQIQLELTVRNRLDTGAEVDFDTARVYDFVIVRENTSSVVWQWSEDQPPFATTPTTLEFAPGETKTYEVVWDQLDNDGDEVREGTYEARGVLVYSGFDSNPVNENQLGSRLKRFTIR